MEKEVAIDTPAESRRAAMLRSQLALDRFREPRQRDVRLARAGRERHGADENHRERLLEAGRLTD